MADEGNPTAGGGTETGAGSAGNPGQETGKGNQDGRTFTQSEVDSINASERRQKQAAQKELEKLQAKLAELERAQLSQAERDKLEAYERGKKEATDSLTAQLTARDIDDAIRAELAERGFPVKALALINAEGRPGSADSAEVKAAVDKALAANPWLQPGGGPASQSGTPSGSGRSPVLGGKDLGAQVRRAMEDGTYAKQRDAFLGALRRK